MLRLTLMMLGMCWDKVVQKTPTVMCALGVAYSTIGVVAILMLSQFVLLGWLGDPRIPDGPADGM